MLDRLASLSAFNYIYAAVLAFVITYVIRKLFAIRAIMKKNDELAMNVRDADKATVIERCAKMFPIETVVFNGDVFKKGMIVKITTMQKKVFQGEFVGKNDMDIICIITREHIIAHEVKKITEMVSIDERKAD